ncbi:MAG: hypothetical protein NPIRA02_00490 [Nitrospirales bacterium]|nr:MAG: hypothetical protein NPIRA02_00490 [Nitrospirales bacterium]
MRSMLLLSLLCVVSAMAGCQSLSVKGSGEEFSANTDVSSSETPSVPNYALIEEQIEEQALLTISPSPPIDTTPEPYRAEPETTPWKELLSAFISTDPGSQDAENTTMDPQQQVGPSASRMWPGGKYVPVVLFDYDQYFLTPHGQEILADASDWLRKDPKSPLVIEGHCDLRGTHAYNLALGHKRALSVKEYLHDMGIDESRLETISYGEAKPICSSDNNLCHTINRRAFVLIKAPREKNADISTQPKSYAFAYPETY